MPTLALLLAVLSQVDLPLSPETQLTSVGQIVTVDLMAVADTSQEIAAIDAVLCWDPAQLELVSVIDGFPWFISGFLPDPDGINLDITDGEAVYTVLASPSSPPSVPPAILVASLRFEVLGTGYVSLLRTLGSSKTRVIGTTPGQDITGMISDPVCIGIPGSWTDLGNGLAGTGGVVPVLTGTGSLVCEDLTLFSLTDAPPGVLCYYLLGISNLSLPFKGGLLIPSLEVIIPLIVPSSGEIVFGFPWPPGLPPGVSLYYQYWFVDPGGPVGFSSSNGLQSTTG